MIYRLQRRFILICTISVLSVVLTLTSRSAMESLYLGIVNSSASKFQNQGVAVRPTAFYLLLYTKTRQKKRAFSKKIKKFTEKLRFFH